MKKLLFLPLLGLLFFTSCEKDKTTVDESPATLTATGDRSPGMVAICHVDGQGAFSLIEVNENALEAHLAHGDHLAVGYYVDADGDGYGTGDPVLDCSQPVGYAAQGGDCDDANPAVYPGATEVCDGVDNDCDGSVDEGLPLETFYADADGDGYGNPDNSVSGCSQPEGYVSQGGDCDDADASVHPGAEDICDDGIDQDCDGSDASCLNCPVFTSAELHTLLSYQPDYGWWLDENTCYAAPLDLYQEVYLYFPGPLGGRGGASTYDFKNGWGRVSFSNDRLSIFREQTITGSDLSACKQILKTVMDEMKEIYPNQTPIFDKCSR